MKNKLLIAGLCFISLVDNAQMNFGIYLNPTIDIGNIEDYSFNYSFGLKSKIPIDEKVAVKAGLGYEHNKFDLTKGIRFEQMPTYVDVQLIKADCHFRFDHLSKEKKISFYTFIGPTININIREQAQYGIFYNSTNDKRIRVYNASIIIGSGFGIPFSRQLVFEIEPACSIKVWSARNTSGNMYNPRLGLNLAVVYEPKKKTAKS